MGDILKRLAIRVIRLLVLFYLVLLLFAFFFAEQMIFAPQPASYRDDGTFLRLTTADGARIRAIHLTNGTARFTVLYSHGNAEDLGDVRPVLEDLVAAGFDVFAYDYHGYGRSEGRPSERNTYRDIDAAYRHLTAVAKVPPSRILVMGRSVGSGPSVDLASREPVGGLIVQSGFSSAFRVMTQRKIAPFDRFDNQAKMHRVTCPVLIMHGSADTVIPCWHGERLFAAANEPKRFLRIEGADHNDFNDVARGRDLQAIRDFAATLRAASEP